ncbi:MAG: FKBP-type peptidyl-prolyl cis-trans isomerase [Paludibacteraceae bacterium]|jgi:FKBP-type peptidyl-prolyl cis-trans isomerase FklB|nr:FKBP-type peptidyl-prolyl cis-trans isomerase [Paludibacteraceae bacterium]
MKKISILLVAMMTMMSCGYKAKTITLESEADSINYALGVLFSSNCQDSTEEGIKEFLDAVKAGHNGEWENMPQTELIGTQIGISAVEFVESGMAGRADITFNGDMFFQGLVNTWEGDTTTVPESEMMGFFMKSMQSETPQGIEYEAKKGSCPEHKAEVELVNFFDSINYIFGALNAQQLKTQLAQGDTITPEEEQLAVLVKAINKGLKTKVYSPATYLGGRQLGMSILKLEKDSLGFQDLDNTEVKFDILFQGMINGLNEYEDMMSYEEADEYIHNLSLNKQYGEWKKENTQWLEANAKKEGVKTTASGLQYKVVKEGTGVKPEVVDTVQVHYEGKLINDTVFDSSYKRGEPISFPLGNVIPGWIEGLQLMSEGAEYELYIPYNLGYGERGSQGAIEPFSTLIFKVELLKVIKAKAEAPQADIQMVQ